MDESFGWKLVERSREDARCNRKGDLHFTTEELERSLIESLENHLHSCTIEELGGFLAFLEQRSHQLHRTDVWAIAYIIHRGCSDDYFDAFKMWIVFQGKDFYSQVLQSPQIVAEIAKPGQELFFHSIFFVPVKLFRHKAGHDYAFAVKSEKALGEPWTDEDLPRLYPHECKKFGF